LTCVFLWCIYTYSTYKQKLQSGDWNIFSRGITVKKIIVPKPKFKPDLRNPMMYPYIKFALKVFVCLFIATRAIFQLSGGCHHCWRQGCKFQPMLGAQGLWAGRDLYRATPTATRHLGLYGLIRKTGNHIPQWDSNPRRKDHQIIAPNALTTAPRRPLKVGNPYKDNEQNLKISIFFLCSRGITLSKPADHNQIRTWPAHSYDKHTHAI
jgi:hypothetical protein